MGSSVFVVIGVRVVSVVLGIFIGEFGVFGSDVVSLLGVFVVKVGVFVSIVFEVLKGFFGNFGKDGVDDLVVVVFGVFGSFVFGVGVGKIFGGGESFYGFD